MVRVERTFEEFFADEYPAQVRTAFVVLGDAELARETVQEAFARAFARWARIKDYDRPGAWVRLVTVRLALRTRDRRTRELKELDDVGVADPSFRDDAVVKAVLALPRSQRAVVALHYLCDWSIDEVARAMGVRPATVRVHLHRARLTLAELLREDIADG